jgi:type II secretory pathway component GspD/PulD (secretin)
MVRRALPLLFIVVALGAFEPARADETVVKVIPLRYRTAADLIPVLAPIAGPEGSVTGLDTRLVVRATPQALARIEGLLPGLDTPPRSLVISVRQGVSGAAAGQSAAVGGVVSNQRTVVTGAFGSSSSTSSDDATQQIRTLDGHPAVIRVGRSEPFNSVGVVGTPSGPVVSGGTVYAESGTGFHVVPRLTAAGVTLELWAENTRGEGPIVVGQDLRTTVSGALGQWIEVGGAMRQAEVRAREVLGASSRTFSEQRSVRVKVDEAR